MEFIKKISLLILLASFFAMSCHSDKDVLEEASNSKEYLEYKQLIDENISHVLSGNLEDVNINVLSKYETIDELVEASIIEKGSLIYKHFKNCDRVTVLNNVLYKKYGLKGGQISLQKNELKDKSYYKNIYKNKNNAND